MNTKLDDAMNVKGANEKLATKVTLLEKRINELKFDKYRNSGHINNLAVTAKKDNKETKAESMAVMDSLLEDLEIHKEMKNSEYLPTMIVNFFKNLKLAKNQGLASIKKFKYPASTSMWYSLRFRYRAGSSIRWLSTFKFEHQIWNFLLF